MTEILGYLVNSDVRTLLFGYFSRTIYRPGLHFSLASVAPNLRFGAWLTADSIINYLNTNLSTLVLARILGAGVAGGGQRGCCATDEAEPNHHPRVVSGIRQNSGRHRKAARQLLQTAVGDGDYQFSGAAGADGDVE